MSLSLQSPGGFGPVSAVIQSQQLSWWPTNYAVSFWLSGVPPRDSILFTSDIQGKTGLLSSISDITYNFTPLVWLGDPTPNINSFLKIDPTSNTLPTPNWAWAVGIYQSNRDAFRLTRLAYMFPASDLPKQGLTYNTFEPDLYTGNSIATFYDVPLGDWDEGRPNHIFFSLHRAPSWYDWITYAYVASNGPGFKRENWRQVGVPYTANQRLCIGSPAIPLDASGEMIIEDLRVYETAAHFDIDRSGGPSWTPTNDANISLAQNLALEIANSRGRDRIALPLFAQVPFMTLTPGTSYPNGGTFEDVTGNLTFTAVTSSSRLSVASSSFARPILGRGRYMSGNAKIQPMQAEFRGRVDGHNETFDHEGAYIDTTASGTAGGRVTLNLTHAWKNVTELDKGSSIENPSARQDALNGICGGLLEDGS